VSHREPLEAAQVGRNVPRQLTFAAYNAIFSDGNYQ
jgi:hypothetical protein